MSTPALCSVIVPLYRHEAYVEEALQSVAAQTYGPLELIVIDDCSPDASHARAQALCESAGFRQRFTRIVVHRKDANRGAHDSLNEGIAGASGKYLAILNSDDRYHPERLQRMIDAMQRANRAFAYSAVQPLLEAGARMHRGFAQLLHFTDHIAPNLPGRSFALLRHNCALTTGNFVLRRDFAARVGLFSELVLAHDWDYLLRAMALEEPLFVGERLYDYRLHAGNTFSAVADRALAENQVCLTRYFQSVAAEPPPNTDCPNPWHWPGVFELFLRQWGLERLWLRMAHGHVAEGRTTARRLPA